MNRSEKELKRRLIEKRKIVKQKLDLLKQGESAHEQIFSPITKHLKNIETKLVPHEKNNLKSVKNEMTEYVPDGNNEAIDLSEQSSEKNNSTPNTYFTPLPSRRRRLELQSTPLNSDNDDYNDDDEPSGMERSIIQEATIRENEFNQNLQNEFNLLRNQSIADKSFREYLEQYEPLPRRYIKDMISDKDKEFDHKYGVVFNEETEKFHIGDSQLKIEQSDIKVQGKKYKGTVGLYELLFKKHPKNYTQQDERNYVDIILKTNAHRRYNKATEQVQGSTLSKYKKIIAPALRHKSGKGVSEQSKPSLLMKYSTHPIAYVHWDNPNELVDRLRLLIASQSAGNTGLTNEINSIIEELREANIIE